MEELYSVPYLHKMDKFGQIRINFSSKIDMQYFVEQFAFLEEGRLLQQQEFEESDRQINQGEVNITLADLTLKFTESMQTKLIPGTNRNIDGMSYTWQLTEFTPDFMALKFEFENPHLVS